MTAGCREADRQPGPPRLFRLWFTLLAVAALVLGAGLARAEDQRARADIWSLKLGAPASALPHDAFDSLRQVAPVAVVWNQNVDQRH